MKYHYLPIKVAKKKKFVGVPLWISGLGVFTTMAWVQSLVWGQRSHMQRPHTMAKTKQKQIRTEFSCGFGG